MLWLILVVAILLVLGFLLIALPRKYYQDVFDTPHFVEFAEGVRRIQAGALELQDKEGEDRPFVEGDPRVFVSSKGIALTYTISVVSEDGENRFLHHFAISQAGRTTVHALGEYFSHYAAILLNLDSPPTDAFRSPVGVHHMEFILNPAEQKEWGQMPVLIPTAETLPEIQKHIVARRERIRFRTPPPEHFTEACL